MARTKKSVETEARIAAAATTLFCTQGYLDTTMAAIADAAGVSVQTLYLRHGSKSRILSAALDIAIAGDAEPVSLVERDWLPRALAEPDPAVALSIWVHGARTICDRTHRLYDVIRSVAADPEVAEVLAKNKRERVAGARMLADALAMRGLAIGAEQAADVLYALTTEDAYLLFVIDRGWSVDDWERWATDTARAQLLGPPTTSSAAGR